MRVRDLPMLYVTFSNVACLIGFPSPFILIQFGWLISWAYLRFYRWNPDSGTRGDRSEAFSFVLWFPPFLHTPVTHISNFLHGLFLRFKVIPEFKYDYVSANDLEFGLGGGGDGPASQDMVAGGSGQGGPVSARAEAERRRAMALKALDQRMASSGGRGPSAAGASSTTPANQAATAAARSQAPAEVVFQAPLDDGAEANAVSSGGKARVEEQDAEWPDSDEEGEEGDIGDSKKRRDDKA